MLPSKQVAPILKKSFVEARLHTDMTPDMPNYKFNERLLAVRDQMIGKGNVGLPQYLVLDPNTGKTLARRAGSAAVEVFREFFEDALGKVRK